MQEAVVTLLLLAAIQGILLTIVLFVRKENHTANKMLAFAVFCLSIDLLSQVYYLKGWYKEFPHLMGISYPFPLLYGPSFYIYAKLVSKKESGFKKHNWLHFIPAMTVYLLCIPIYFYNGEQKIEFVKDMMHGVHPPLFSVFEAILPFQGMLYTFFTFKVIREYDRKIKDAFSNIDLINLNWLKYITSGGLVIWSIVLSLYLLRPLTHSFGMLIQISISILIYAIGYKALKQPEIFLQPSAISIEPSPSEKYRRSGLSDENAEEIKHRLLALMTAEKPFLSQDLTLQKLAERLKTSTHNLSEVVNTKLHLSYYDFINQYRIEEFKNRLADPESERYNLLSIAFDSGFKSKGTFNSIFKKTIGMTPSEYKLKINLPSK